MISPASERSELAGAEELRCGPPAGLLGSGEDASVRAHLPLSDHPECVARDVWADWSSAAGCPAAERREAHSSHRWAEGESVHGLPGAVSDEYGQCRSPLRDGLAPAR